MLSKSQILYLRMEARGLKSLPLATRRHVARAIERDPGIDAIALAKGSVILIQVKSARKEVSTGLRHLAAAMRMVDSDPEIMRGTPVYKGTRIPVQTIADMLSQGATAEIVEGYPALTRAKVELAPMYVKATPSSGPRPSSGPEMGMRYATAGPKVPLVSWVTRGGPTRSDTLARTSSA